MNKIIEIENKIYITENDVKIKEITMKQAMSIIIKNCGYNLDFNEWLGWEKAIKNDGVYITENLEFLLDNL